MPFVSARLPRACLALLVAITVGCSNDDAPTAPVPLDPTFTMVTEALTHSCAYCHDQFSGRRWVVTMDSATLVRSGFINFANPAASLLLRKGRGGLQHLGAFTSRDSALFHNWVARLAPSMGAPRVTVAVAYDATRVAFRLTWRSQPKLLPVGRANVGQVYPMAYHDIMRYAGSGFDRMASGSRLEEDRVTFMIQPVGGSVSGFTGGGCYATCHNTVGGMTHRLPVVDTLDHWHWRGARSGPMGYAEDAAVDHTARIRDGIGSPYPKWTRSAGDRIREDQAAITSTGIAEVNGMPRFVFNKGKALPGGHVVPRYFLATAAGATMTDPYTQIPAIKDVSVNRSLLVAYQDLAFDPVDKVNALDVGYLAHVATRGVAHLPSHLRDTLTTVHQQWRAYWAAQSGIASNDSSGARARLAAIVAEWEGAGRNAMVTRSIGFIYPSDQHDITSQSSFDASTGTWTVTLYRRLAATTATDADLSGLSGGGVYTIGFAMHDVGGGSESHDVSLPYTVGNATGADIRATQVGDVRTASWSSLPTFQTNWVNNAYKVSMDVLQGSRHPGRAEVPAQRCQQCHGPAGDGRLLTY